MSSSADAAVAAVAGIFASRHCNVAAAALFMYDTLITFDREVACFWTSKRNGAALLFFANRWIPLTYNVMLLASLASFPSDKSCAVFISVTYAIGVVQFIPGAVFSALRAYVLSRSKLLGLIVFALSLAVVGANLVLYGYQFSGQNFLPFGCFEIDNNTAALDLKFVKFNHIPYIGTYSVQGVVVIISRVPLIVADILLIYITWTKLSSRRTLRDVSQSKRLSLSDILLRGGILYFAILSILNVLHLVLSATAVAGDTNGSYVTIFTGQLTAILISRFLLELQEVNQMDVRLDPDNTMHSLESTPSFISSLGGFVNPALSAQSDEDGDFELPARSRSTSTANGDEEEEGVRPESPQPAASSSLTA